MNDQQEKQKVPFAQQAAKASLFAPLIAIVVNLFTIQIKQDSKSAALIITTTCSLMIIAGLIFGIIALFGIRKHGKTGILWRSILGLLLNGFLIVSALLVFQSLSNIKKKLKTPQYSFSPPTSFVEYPEGKQQPNIVSSLIKGDSKDDIPDIICFLEDLGGRIKQEDLSKYIGNRTDVTLIKMKWKGRTIDVFRIEEQLQGIEFLTFNAQIPLIPRAIQVKLVGLKSMEKELIEDLQSIISGIDGNTNW